MNLIYRIFKTTMLLGVVVLAISSCDKLSRPALGDYPKDSNPPGGPLKFYAAMDGGNVDSIRANFGLDNDVSYVSGGVSGEALQPDGSKNGYVAYPSANDFASSTNFTISFWLNIKLAQKDNVNADGVLSLASTSNFWGNFTFYADHTTGGNSDSMDLKIHFANGSGDNWDFAGYTGNKRWPKMYDGQWHHVVFVYDAGAKTGTLYRDGVQFDQKTNETIAFDGKASQLIVAGFQQAAGVVDTYANNSWMSGFPGMIDQVRLYGEALAPADVAALYASKQ